MRNPIRGRLLSLALSFGLLAGVAHAEPPCADNTALNASCEIALDAVRPTQPAVGMIQVEERVRRMKGETDTLKFTRSRPLPVVRGPDGNFYLTDGHHLASVLSRIGAERMVVQVIGRLDDSASFWREMQARHWVYLFDPQGRPLPPERLPRRIADLWDDPYRALAAYAESAGYFHKTDAYFMEFEWARYFGERMGWKPVDRLNLLPALQEAEKLACQPQASALPGYAGPCKTPQ
ncbi:hypothetical protein SAMN06265795_104202 [Noviherbaspirillum humi]|uniref:ParB-like nuclease n=1 Tax=Noviherbaspirillum humi TaxID=1688639 RepID=A0A239G2Z7_9BURK|nr:ParB-like protein [Noviherbaspirillum humi]SNS62942.1 hypothetical protein SAMN06265795_104202 [Noviherbaspirillum humi]